MAKPAWRTVDRSLEARGPKRALRLLETPPWVGWRTKSESSRAIRWVETYLPVPVGYRAGEPIKLAGFQRKILRSLYDSLATFVSIPAANGKSTLLAGAAIERLCRGDAYAEVDVLATKREQAAIVVETAKRFVELVPELSELCSWYANPGVLEFRPTGSRMMAHPARLSSLQGLNFSLAIVDEVGFAQDELIEALIARLAKRPDAHLIGIGTPGFEPNILHRIREEHLAGELPAGVDYLEWSAPPGAELMDRRAWRAANPGIGAGFMAEPALAVQAELMPEATFRTYHLGQWVEQAAGWLPGGAWAACPMAPPPPDGAEVVIAVWGTYKRTVAVEAASLDGSVFHVWAAETPPDETVARVLELALERWEVREIVHPSRIRGRLFAELGARGFPVRAWAGGAELEAASANELYRAILERRIAHDHDGLVEAHMDALAARTAVDGSLRLTAPEDGRPTDAAFAARAAWWRAFELAGDAGPIAIY